MLEFGRPFYTIGEIFYQVLAETKVIRNTAKLALLRSSGGSPTGMLRDWTAAAMQLRREHLSE